ncbi:MAG: alpha/beta hydrolase [Clostridium sp.]
MNRVNRKVASAILTGVMTVTALGVVAVSEVKTVFASVKCDVSAVHAKVEQITYSLKNNYLGLKNVGQWQLYINEARRLNAKLTNGSSRDNYSLRINQAEDLVNAVARVNKVENSMRINAHIMKNVPEWQRYINLGKSNLMKVDKNIFGKQITILNERIEKRIVEINKIKDREYIIRENLSFGVKGFQVNGELVKPKDAPKNMKTVIIVGGSGPTDRDCTIGSNKPYKDLAEGLAKRGVASFRYDKRAYAYKDKITQEIALNMTLKEEYLEDYNEIIKYLLGRDDINKNNIYVAGHSQGGNIIPMMEKMNSTPKGYIFMAAPHTAIEDILITQLEYLLSITPGVTEEMKKQQMDYIKAEVTKIKAINESSENTLILGASTKYWLGYKGYDPAKEAERINKPMLFVQGLNDYNVSEFELNQFKKVLGDKNNVKFITYEGLTHLFTKGDKTPNAYNKKEEMSDRVIDDIAEFIN